jgi:iron(III) transport system ATP-binding protein
LLAGLDAPSAGEILLDGEAVSTAGSVLRPPYRRGVAMVFQDLALWPNLTAIGNVLLGLAGADLSKPDRRARALDALALCGITDLADRRPATLSGGQQQRIALARAIAVRPRFLLLDEPFSGLDLVTKTHLLPQVVELAAKTGSTMVVVDHDPRDVERLCPQAVVLQAGRLMEQGEWSVRPAASGTPSLPFPAPVARSGPTVPTVGPGAAS